MPLKRISCLCLTLFVCICTLLSGCDLESLNWNPQGDWNYELCEDYHIFRVNSSTIELTKKDNGLYLIVVEEYITRFCYNDDYIAVRRLLIPQHAMFDDIMQMDFDQAKYYLINAHSGEVFGPFATQEEFETICSEQKTGSLGEWINTYPAPEGAKF